MRKSRIPRTKQDKLNKKRTKSFVLLIETRREGLHQDHSRWSATTLVPIIETKVIPDSIVYSDCWTGYNVLDVSDFKHYHINGIENFWNQAKRHMRKFNGAPKDNFGLFLKECEWCFNTPSLKCQLTQLKQ